MPWTPLDLLFSIIGRLASSKEAKTAEQERVVATLRALRSSLVALMDNHDGPATQARGPFANAASDLFCHAKVLGGDQPGRMDGVASEVEAVLRSLEQGAPSRRDADDLLASLDAELALWL